MTVPGCGLWLLLPLCSDDCARCKIKEQKLKDFYLIFCPWSDTEQNQERRGERVVPSPTRTKRITWAWLGLERATEYYQTCHKRKWRTEILSGSHIVLRFQSWLVIPVSLPSHSQSREKSWIVPLQEFNQKDAVWLWLQTCNQPLPYVTCYKCKSVTAHNSKIITPDGDTS